MDSLSKAKGREIIDFDGKEVKVTALLQQAVRIGKPIIGVIIPLFVLIVSFIVTWLLYKHFSKHT